jgi:hypothetical protein
MRTAAICPTCATYTNAVCVVYDGPYLSNLDINPLTNLDEIIGIIDNKVQLKLGFTPENVANKSTNTSLGTSNTLYPTQKAVKTYVDSSIAAIPTPTLQQVTDADNTTTQAIYSTDVSNTVRASIQTDFITGLPQVVLEDDNSGKSSSLTSEYLSFTNGALANNVKVKATNVASPAKSIELPNANGTLVVSVNGVGAGTNGNVTLPVPNLQQVTTVGNSSNVGIVLNSPIVNDTQWNGLRVFDSDTNSIYVRPTSIYADLEEGQTLLQFLNTTGGPLTINTPQANGTLALSVNGTYADSTGNITLPTSSNFWNLTGNASTNPLTNFIGTTGAQDLVFKVNNTEYLRFNSSVGNNDEVSFLKNIKLTGTNPQIWVNEQTNGGYVTINANATDRGTITFAQNLTNRIIIKSSNITGTSKALQLPNASGTLALSVNGNNANTSGNVVVNLQSVLNAGNSVTNNFQGTNAGTGNTGAYIIAFGLDAGENNTGNEVTAFGSGAAQGNQLSGVTMFSNLTLPTYADHTAASLAITVALGATAGCTYLYHNQATNSIGAVRL